jgi:PTH1 family peptidyl-tRNA hydrolase
MKLIAGLGNPGSEYALTRHNIGFMILDYVAESLKCEFKAGKGEFYIARAKYNGDEIILLKPTTYMNNSGIAVQEVLEMYPDIGMNDVLIIFDDFQLKLGTIRIRERGSGGGHNGISSIIYHLNSMDIPRMRVGTGRGEILRKDEYVDFVLSNFTEEEAETIKVLLPTYKDCVLSFVKDSFKSVMNQYNRHFLEEEKETGEEDTSNPII